MSEWKTGIQAVLFLSFQEKCPEDDRRK